MLETPKRRSLNSRTSSIGELLRSSHITKIASRAMPAPITPRLVAEPQPHFGASMSP